MNNASHKDFKNIYWGGEKVEIKINMELWNMV
jgi:hypothetical protein